ncbi:MAG: hypothetical protein H6702_01560 [Myxococcales bacterium]|nr:hypothetical protein [Myxococcales bacterium]
MRALLVAGLGGLLLACGGPGPVRWRPDPAAQQGSYEDQVAAWTRHGEAYQDLESRLLVDATLLSPAFAEAYAREEVEVLGLTGTEATDRVRGRVAQADTTQQFLVALVTNDLVWNDLDKPRPTLQVRLVKPDGQVPPLSIRRLDLRALFSLKAYFPHVTPMHTLYWVTFPPRRGDEPVRLRFAGPPATVDLLWEVAP